MGDDLPLAVLGVVVTGAVVAIYAERRRLDRDTEAFVQDLLALSPPCSERTFQTSDCASLPGPIRRYLTHVLRDGQPFVRAVRVHQRGTFRSEGTASAWHSYPATQHIRTDPPAFVWDASVEMIPWISVRVLDAYHEGRGLLRAKLGGVLPVAHPAPGPELNEGELMRYLAEAPLYPAALNHRGTTSPTSVGPGKDTGATTRCETACACQQTGRWRGSGRRGRRATGEGTWRPSSTRSRRNTGWRECL